MFSHFKYLKPSDVNPKRNGPNDTEEGDRDLSVWTC